MEHIVVVGSGISGMSAAAALSERYRVTLVEALARPGGHTNTVMVSEQDRQIPVDTGFIVYNEPNYPHLTRLFAHLDITTRATEMSFAVSLDDGAFEFAGSNLAALFCQPSNLFRPRFHKMLADIRKFNNRAKDLANSTSAADAESLTVDAFLKRERLGEDFRNRYLLPMAAAIWSCPREQMGAFPMISMAHFFRNHGLLNIVDRPLWRTVVGGSQVYAKVLLATLDSSVKLDSAVHRIDRTNDKVAVCDRQGHRLECDHVVLATHADDSLQLLATPSDDEQAVLSAFSYQANTAVLHTDSDLMPRRRRAWSSWNYLAHTDQNGSEQVSVSYWMNRLQGLEARNDYFVSLNPLQEPHPGSEIARFEYAHPVFDLVAMQAQHQLARIQGAQNTWFCGAWCGYGFHEDGLRSGLEVSRALGAMPSWSGFATDNQRDTTASNVQGVAA